MHAGEEGHARPGWTTSRRGQDSPWKSQSEWQRTEINGESTSMVWQTLGSRTAKEQNSRDADARDKWARRVTGSTCSGQFVSVRVPWTNLHPADGHFVVSPECTNPWNAGANNGDGPWTLMRKFDWRTGHDFYELVYRPSDSGPIRTLSAGWVFPRYDSQLTCRYCNSVSKLVGLSENLFQYAEYIRSLKLCAKTCLWPKLYAKYEVLYKMFLK